MAEWCPPKDRSTVWLLGPVDICILGKGVFADIIQLMLPRWVILDYLSGPPIHDKVLIEEDAWTQREETCGNGEGRGWSDVAAGQGPSLPSHWGGAERCSRSCRRSAALLLAELQSSALLKSERAYAWISVVWSQQVLVTYYGSCRSLIQLPPCSILLPRVIWSQEEQWGL